MKSDKASKRHGYLPLQSSEDKNADDLREQWKLAGWEAEVAMGVFVFISEFGEPSRACQVAARVSAAVST